MVLQQGKPLRSGVWHPGDEMVTVKINGKEAAATAMTRQGAVQASARD